MAIFTYFQYVFDRAIYDLERCASRPCELRDVSIHTVFIKARWTNDAIYACILPCMFL